MSTATDEHGQEEPLLAAESDPAGLGAAKLQVGNLVGRHEHPAAFGGSQCQHSALGNGGPERGLDLVCFRVGLDNELARRGLYPDLDFHCSPFGTPRLAPCQGRPGKSAGRWLCWRSASTYRACRNRG